MSVANNGFRSFFELIRQIAKVPNLAKTNNNGQRIPKYYAAMATAAAQRVEHAQTDTMGGRHVLTEKMGGVYRIIFNRPQRKNALTNEMYKQIDGALRDAANSKDTVITVLSAKGDYYSSGNDLSNFTSGMSDPAAMAKAAHAQLLSFVGAFIDHPKPLIALVNGPAIGISVTTLALCDVVLASEAATFNTPFGQLGQTAEGCSSQTFPFLMGRGVSTEVLMFGRKLSAHEAQKYRLVTEVYPQNHFDILSEQRINEFAKMPPNTMAAMKGLLSTKAHRAALHATNKRECDQLVECWQSEECAMAIMQFFENQQLKKKSAKL